MGRFPAFILAIAAISACDASPILPGGYKISYGDRGKAWLQGPEGDLAHPGLIKSVHRDQRRILLIAHAVSYAGRPAPPHPLDGNCYVALLFDGPTRLSRQIRLAEAERLSSRMQEVESWERPCLKDMPTE